MTEKDEDTALRVVHSTVEVEWKIQKFFYLPNGIGDCLDSSPFTFSDVEWFLSVYPNGCYKEYSGCISLCLCKRPTPSVLSVSFTIGIKKVNGSVIKSSPDGKTEFEKHEVRRGYLKFLKRSELFNSEDIVAMDDTLVVFCIIRIEKSSTAASQTSFSSNGVPEIECDQRNVEKTLCQQSVDTLSDNFKELFLSGRQGDVTIRVRNKKFVAHRLVLTARSPVFRAMFELDMAEKNSGDINIDDCDPDSFDDFLLFLYSGKLDVVSAINALGLYPTANKYDMKQLKQACSKCLDREISVDSVCDVVHLATLHDETELLNTATTFFVNNANKIVMTPKWFSFMVEHPTLANELLVKMTNKYINMETKIIS